jgi:hypothetical protein
MLMETINLAQHKRLISEAAAKIAAHKEFQKAYNQELAFDFDIFSFFKTGENKVSEIIAFFLDPSEKHGQGDLFLLNFMDHLESISSLNSEQSLQFKNSYQTTSRMQVILEKSIDSIPDKRPGLRRIDIYIPLEDFGVAIENKIWAADQVDQLSDYSAFLGRLHPKGYLLVYLTPYGHKPDGTSISDEEWEKGLKDGSFCIMSYKDDILTILETWEAKCKAERVRSFIREFRNHLNVKFLGGNHLGMDKALEDLVVNNRGTVKQLANAYLSIESDLKAVVVEVARIFKNDPLENTENIGPFTNKELDYYAFKIAVPRTINVNFDEKSVDTIFIHLSVKDLQLRLKYYIEKDISDDLRSAVQSKWEETKMSNSEISKPKKSDEEGLLLIIDSNVSSTLIAELMRSKVNLIKTISLQ